MIGSGAFWFGIVIGYVTYRTLQHKPDSGITDIASVIGAVGGAAVVGLFPTDTGRFDTYAIGLATGFFGYLIISLGVAYFVGVDKAKLFLGDTRKDADATGLAPRRFDSNSG